MLALDKKKKEMHYNALQRKPLAAFHVLRASSSLSKPDPVDRLLLFIKGTNRWRRRARLLGRGGRERGFFHGGHVIWYADAQALQSGPPLHHLKGLFRVPIHLLQSVLDCSHDKLRGVIHRLGVILPCERVQLLQEVEWEVHLMRSRHAVDWAGWLRGWLRVVHGWGGVGVRMVSVY